MTSRRQLQLKTRAVSIESLNQREIYAGQIEGLPTREKNKELIASALTRLRAAGAAPYLVPPVETPIPYPRGDYPFGEPAALPRVICVASCRSPFPARDSSKDASHMTIVWFQDDYAFPIEPSVQEHLSNLEWERLAVDYEL